MPGLKITVIDENIPETGDEFIDEMLEVDDNVIEQVTEENTSAETDDIGTSATYCRRIQPKLMNQPNRKKTMLPRNRRKPFPNPCSRNIRMRASKNSAIPEA